MNKKTVSLETKASLNGGDLCYFSLMCCDPVVNSARHSAGCFAHVASLSLI